MTMGELGGSKMTHDFEDEGRAPTSQDHRQPLGTGRGKEPRDPRRNKALLIS
jgi:hypothetical protein